MSIGFCQQKTTGIKFLKQSTTLIHNCFDIDCEETLVAKNESRVKCLRASTRSTSRKTYIFSLKEARLSNFSEKEKTTRGPRNEINLGISKYQRFKKVLQKNQPTFKVVKF
ncbi:hypothetical protein ACFFRR_003056 [Megaselia abdita]